MGCSTIRLLDGWVAREIYWLRWTEFRVPPAPRVQQRQYISLPPPPGAVVLVFVCGCFEDGYRQLLPESQLNLEPREISADASRRRLFAISASAPVQTPGGTVEEHCPVSQSRLVRRGNPRVGARFCHNHQDPGDGRFGSPPAGRSWCGSLRAAAASQDPLGGCCS